MALPTLERHARHRAATARWLVRSIEHGRGGSCAHFSLAGGWSRPYPETTGYLIPTLLALDASEPDLGLRRRALALGRWLLSIQGSEGAWNAGLHPPRAPRASVFNTGQVLDGMVALHRAGAGAEFLEAGHRAARWIAGRAGADGLWGGGDYRASRTPSYYTHVHWPLLEVWRETGDESLRACAERGLASILARLRPGGAIAHWGFGDGERASTHTIAYTLRGVLEASRILDAWDDLGARVVPALERLLRKAELRGGRLAGELDLEWRATGRFECLTGSAQTALNLLLLEERQEDLRIVNAAAKLLDRVCDSQSLDHPLPGLRGAVAGSRPVWGRYLRLRYPSWGAKFLCDALLALAARVEREEARALCASS